MRLAATLVLGVLLAAHLLGLEVFVEEIQSLLIASGGSSDSEHALARFVMRSFGDGNTGTRALSDLTDLCATTSNDAANHVGWDANVLGLDFFSILSMGRGRRSVQSLIAVSVTSV